LESVYATIAFSDQLFCLLITLLQLDLLEDDEFLHEIEDEEVITVLFEEILAALHPVLL
jgi:hypothetical protein